MRRRDQGSEVSRQKAAVSGQGTGDRRQRTEVRDQKAEERRQRTDGGGPGAGRGFTLIELILVVVIIGMLAAMVVPRLAGRTEQAKIARAKADIATIGLSLDLYELDAGAYPSSLDELVAKEPPSNLSDEAKSQWNGPYLKKGLPQDPWGRPYVYTRESQHGQDYDLASLGADGQPGNDDITNWAQ